MRLDTNKVRQRSFLQNKSIISLVLLLNGAIFLPIGIIVSLLIQPGMMITVNDVRRPATESDVLIARLLGGGIFGVLGLIFLIIGIVLLIRRGNRRREMERLKKDGTLVVADAVDCELSKVRVGGHVGRHGQQGFRSLCYLRCSYQTLGGETYIFKSDLLREDPTPYLDDGKVNVYCDRVHMTPYFVDVDGSIGRGSRVFEV